MPNKEIIPSPNNIKRAVRRTVELDVRLRILQIISYCSSHRANMHVLHAVLQQFGHRLSYDYIETQLSWLDEQGLIDFIREECVFADLTDRGIDIAKGRAQNTGVGLDTES